MSGRHDCVSAEACGRHARAIFNWRGPYATDAGCSAAYSNHSPTKLLKSTLTFQTTNRNSLNLSHRLIIIYNHLIHRTCNVSSLIIVRKKFRGLSIFRLTQIPKWWRFPKVDRASEQWSKKIIVTGILKYQLKVKKIMLKRQPVCLCVYIIRT